MEWGGEWQEEGHAAGCADMGCYTGLGGLISASSIGLLQMITVYSVRCELVMWVC